MTKYYLPLQESIPDRPRIDAASATEALKFVRQVRSSVSEVSARIDSRRDARVAQLLAGRRSSNGFLLGQTALLASGISPGLSSIVGTLPLPIDTPGDDFSTSLKSGDVTAIRFTSTFGYFIPAGAPTSIKCMLGGEVSDLMDADLSAECPLTYAQPLSNDAVLERQSNVKCAYGRYVSVSSGLPNGQKVRIVYGMLGKVTVSVGQAVSVGDVIGEGAYVVIDAFTTDGARVSDFILYVRRPLEDKASRADGYDVDQRTPYGPAWQSIRPGGYPTDARRTSSRGATLAQLREIARSAVDDSTFVGICEALHVFATGGGYAALPSPTFDVRGSAEEVASGAFDAVPPVAFEDVGPFPRESGGAIITDPYRDALTEGFDSRWGSFQIDLTAWRGLCRGFSFGAQSSSYVTSVTEPWSGTFQDEVKPVILAMAATWRALESAPVLYRAFAMAGVITSSAITSTWGSGVGAVLDEDTLRTSWLGLSSSLDQTTGMLGSTFTRIVEDIVTGTQRRSLKSSVPELATAQAVSAPSTPSDLNGPRPYQYVRVPADGIGTGRQVLSYSYTQISSEFEARYRAVYERATELGGWVTSGGGRRSLSASRPHGIGMHNIGRAVDMAPYTGLYSNANTDPNMKYLIIRDRPGDMRSKFTTWAIVDTSKPGYDAVKAAEAEAAGIIQNRTWTVDLVRSMSDQSTYTWTGKAFNLTQIFEQNGFVRISPIDDFLVHGKFRGVEWWHYEIREGLVTGVTTIGDEIHKLYTYSQAALGPERHPNYDQVVGKKWRGSVF